jgi:hypothetical protein
MSRVATPPPNSIFRQPTPEEAELSRRRAELAALRQQLTAQEQALAGLRATLHSFEGRYIRQVGVLYLQLDEWYTRIAELDSALPLPEGIATPEPDAEPYNPPNPARPGPEAPDDLRPHLDLKALFREVAKRIHPDFATDDHDERHRTHLMAQANAAYLRDDAAGLRRLLNGHDPAEHSPADTAAELARTLDLIRQSGQDLVLIAAEIEALTRSEMADLQQRTLAAATEGRDLLAELAARVKGSIGIAMRRYELDLGRARRKEKPFDPTPLLSAERSR